MVTKGNECHLIAINTRFVPSINKIKSYIETASPTWIDGSTKV